MDFYVDPGRMVRVIYKDDDTTMFTSGTVIRCEKSEERRYRIGVVFDHPHREDSNQFYNKVKSFLDSDRPGGTDTAVS